MSRFAPLQPLRETGREIKAYLQFFYKYLRRRGYVWFAKFETLKDVIVDLLYKRRGKYSRPLLHFGTVGLVFFAIILGPIFLEQRRREEEPAGSNSAIMSSALAYGADLSTPQSAEVLQVRGGEVENYTVKDGDTLSSIAQRFNLQPDTIIWENGLDEKAKLKPGQELRILPIDGVRHKVARGETIYTIAKKYGLDESQAQAIVDYPFNEFKNDETFELTIGQNLMVPNGVKPDEPSAPASQRPAFATTLTPSAGSVTASGSFVWPAAGIITQRYSFFHKAFDIANRGGGPIVAADSGTVIAAGWDSSGYGNKVMVDHGNGYITLYGHLSLIQVKEGQTVTRGSVLGQMGSTGHSTGTHCHFEIRHGGVLEDPGKYLK
jgi:murein DD-endopeptidase MepM/ murein hydrolase activator NlpD